MDISVSRLNERMALQLPAQFPLGLVFVVGTVDAPTKASNGDGITTCFLIEKNHRLRCLLSARASKGISLEEGSRIRAGGHLAFDPTRADYFLLARDVELIAEEFSRLSSLTEIIQDYNQRSQAAGLVPADLPTWVKRMAPMEVQQEWQDSIEKTASESLPGILTETTPHGETRPGLLGLGHDVAIAGLSDELLDFLSEAMDSEEEIELTPDLVAGFTTAEGSSANDKPAEAASGSSKLSAGREEAGQQQRRGDEWGSSSEERRTVPWIPVIVVLIILLLVTAGIIFAYMFF